MGGEFSESAESLTDVATSDINNTDMVPEAVEGVSDEIWEDISDNNSYEEEISSSYEIEEEFAEDNQEMIPDTVKENDIDFIQEDTFNDFHEDNLFQETVDNNELIDNNSSDNTLDDTSEAMANLEGDAVDIPYNEESTSETVEDKTEQLDKAEEQIENMEVDDSSEDDDSTEEQPKVKVLKRDEFDLLKSGNDAINQRLEVKADDYRDKGLGEAEIEERLEADKRQYQEEFLNDAFPGQDISPDVFSGFNKKEMTENISEDTNNEASYHDELKLEDISFLQEKTESKVEEFSADTDADAMEPPELGSNAEAVENTEIFEAIEMDYGVEKDGLEEESLQDIPSYDNDEQYYLGDDINDANGVDYYDEMTYLNDTDNYEEMSDMEYEEEGPHLSRAPAVDSVYNSEHDIPILPQVSDVSREIIDVFPENRKVAIDAAFVNAPKEIIDVINEYSDGLKHIRDSGYSQNINGEWVKDGCYYTDGSDTITMDENMTNAEYAEVFPHELGHYIDCQRGWESTGTDFTEAVSADFQKMNPSTPEGMMRMQDMLDDAFSTGAAFDRSITDILSAVFENNPTITKRFYDEAVAYHHPDSYYAHDNNYWDINGMRQKEIYANCMAAQIGQSRIAVNFIERWFPNIDKSFKTKLNMNE